MRSVNPVNCANVHGNNCGQKVATVLLTQMLMLMNKLLLLCWELHIAAQERVSLCCNTRILLYTVQSQTRLDFIITYFIGVMEQNNNFSPVDLCVVYGQFMAEVIWLHCYILKCVSPVTFVIISKYCSILLLISVKQCLR